MTREQFEAHVRAEALKKHPDAWIVTDQSIIDRSDYRRTYIAARMEHEWPPVEALQKLIALPSKGTRWAEWIHAETVLRRYTNPDTQNT